MPPVATRHHSASSPVTARPEDIELLDAALSAADAAAAVIRARAADVASLAWTAKRPTDFVSEVDTTAEERIREVVVDRIPGAVVLGEELSPDAETGRGIVVVADPLDGTTNFLHGYPWFAVSIGVLHDGELAAGVVLNAATGERFAAVRGGGATRDGVPIRVSAITEPARALVGTGFPFKDPAPLERYLRQFARVAGETAGIRRAGAAALDLADVACGRFEAFWELMLAPWDVAAGILLVREAGGVVTDLDGRPSVPAHGHVH